MKLIPAGEFILGLDPAEELPAFVSDQTSAKNAQPRQEVFVEAFYLDVQEVTYGDFMKFKSQAKYPEGKPSYPMQGVSWYEADAYCMWVGKRLPTELEWEKAARGQKGNLFTWGNDFKRENANFGKAVQPSATYPADVSEFGVFDLNGNVSEWTASWYRPYPHSQYRDPGYGKNFKVMRGGAFNKREHGFMKELVLLPYRNFAPPHLRSWDTGFRCARSAPPQPVAS